MTPSDPQYRIDVIRIKEIMIPIEDYPSVSPETTIHEAMAIMEQASLHVAGRRSLPRVLLVLDEQGVLKGTVRRRDIMRGLEPKYLVTQPLNYRKKLFDVSIDPNLSQLSPSHLVKGIREQAEKPVSTVMRPIEIGIEANDHVIKAIYEMVGYGLTLLPVVEDGNLVGIVRTVELFKELSHIVHFLEEDLAE